MATLISASGPEQAALAVWAGHGLHRASFAIFSISLVLASVTRVLVGVAMLAPWEAVPDVDWIVVGGGRDRGSDHGDASGGEWPNPDRAMAVPGFRSAGDHSPHYLEHPNLAQRSQAVALGAFIRPCRHNVRRQPTGNVMPHIYDARLYRNPTLAVASPPYCPNFRNVYPSFRNMSPPYFDYGISSCTPYEETRA